ncbi:chemotaxis protein methyltransferase CheR [Halanaerobium saccharolyticum]|uniref:protein-glutamate O-methyltransferase n=1 Tax=Halanaerobium saccharolyticum TaxID=43595 RepID=A0A4R7YL80_9FIRM|nr:protein-glutamate O-methyltransferase CheR [Halanaerobium saccharolyticum]RAK04873.1 chemotaxis protein methyltransferase CheR [Halanaerobium saccharolyticum]TDV98270.1 chemotaxis protein methyltransferase CheR [Halanaerobium saccharolyticum]TDX51117.1 chemotaxis protein methyltransferase CheR [Halanaerobium saccharolyticum]
MKIKAEDIDLLNKILAAEIGITISADKGSMLDLRLSKRINELNLKTIKQYVSYIENTAEEKNILFNLLTTNYTKFFREKFHFQLLFRSIIPEIRENKNKVRIWSAGCSTGEEPYTIAMLLAYRDLKFEILATDINGEVLNIARRGIYNENKINRIDSKYVYKYFQKGVGKYSGYYKIKNLIRDKVTFKKLNLNSSFSQKNSEKFDIIFCRNVLIYFKEINKKRVIKEFYRALNDSGYLVLGHSESIDLTDHKNHSWRKIGSNSYQKIGG